MPNVATAPTATAAQTSAAGSRILGYYLGGGGVKVDCLFDTANFLTAGASGAFTTSAVLTAQELHIDANHYIGASSSNNRDYWFDAGDVLRYSRDVNQLQLITGGIVRFTMNPNVASFSGVGSLMIPDGVVSSPGICFANDTNTGIYRFAADTISFVTNGGTRWGIASGGNIYPNFDNMFDIGAAANRVRVIYAATGTINTSDADEKDWLATGLSSAELQAARRIAADIGTFRWLASVAEKGDDARTHVGVRAQAVWAIMADEGLIDPIAEGEPPSSRYAFLCYDAWDAVEATPEERDEEGNITVEAVEGREADARFGIRPDQLALFLIAAQEARLAALEAA